MKMNRDLHGWMYWRIIIRNGFTLLILDIFIFIAVTLVNLLPSVYDRVQASFGLRSPVPIMTLEAFFIIIAASVAIYWGYLIDKVDRKRILFQSMAVWIVGALICTFATNFPIFVLGRIITAIGLGAQMPASYSIVADIVPSRFWSTLYGGLALLVSICNATGNFLSGFLSPMNIWGLGWQFPFALLSLLSVGCFFLLMLIHLPNRGASSIEEIDKELGDRLRRGDIVYQFTIKKEDLLPLWKINCNRWMLYACFFAIIPGAAMGAFLVYYFVNDPFASFPVALRTQVSAIFAGMAGVGYMLGVLVMGPFFDWFHQRVPRARSRLTFWGLVVAMPLLIAAFLCITPVDYASLELEIDSNDASFSIEKYVIIVSAIFERYPIYIAYFFLLLFGGLAAAPMAINRTPTLLEVNLPEHQGSSQAILNFSDQVGKGFTLLLLAFQFVVFSFLNLRIFYVLLFSMFFYIPPIIWWRMISRQIDIDRTNKLQLLKERAQSLQKAE
jgi:MFS family permease